MDKRLGLALAVFRARQGKISQKQLATDTRLTQKALSRLETGIAKGVDFETLEKLGKFFGCHPRELLDFVEFPATVAEETKPKPANGRRKRQDNGATPTAAPAKSRSRAGT